MASERTVWGAMQPMRLPGTVVAGGGPGGLFTALELHEAGRPVVLLEARGKEALRRNTVLLDYESLKRLRSVGAPVDEYMQPETAAQGFVALGRLENHLRALAAERGVLVSYDTPVTGIRQLGDGGVEVTSAVARAGQQQLLHADEVVNATGGRTGLEEALGMGLVARPGSIRYAVGHWP